MTKGDSWLWSVKYRIVGGEFNASSAAAWWLRSPNSNNANNVRNVNNNGNLNNNNANNTYPGVRAD